MAQICAWAIYFVLCTALVIGVSMNIINTVEDEEDTDE